MSETKDNAAFPQVSSLQPLQGTSGEFAAMVQLEQQRIQGLTARQYAAIALRVPDSGEPWLDQMIQRARLLDAATHAMAAMLSVPAPFFGKNLVHEENGGPQLAGENALAYAEALLNAK